MRKWIAIPLVSFVILGAGVSTASAWWPFDGLFGHGCCAHVCCRQYNAFSPFCCEGAVGCNPMSGYGCGGFPGCSCSGDQGYLGELPALGATGDTAVNGQMMPPSTQQPAPSSAPPTPRETPQALQPAMPPQTFPIWGGGMMNPGNVPGTYPSYPGFIGYGPANGFGR